MLKLRRGTVVEVDPLTVEIDGERRRAWGDPGMVGPCDLGDEVIVNTEALDLGLGSGGFDIVHVNLTQGLGSAGADGPHVMKLNYTSLQHPVSPVEEGEGEDAKVSRRIPVLVIPLHGHLAPAAWAAAEHRPGLQIGYVQTAGGALPGALSEDVGKLRERGLLCGHVTAGAAYGGEHEAISVVGALHAAAGSLAWDAVIAGPGPGILGSASPYGHGGMAALDTAHAALALGLPTLLSPRLSDADPRPRHRGVSHHTESALGLLLGGVRVPVPSSVPEAESRLTALAGPEHQVTPLAVDLDAYAASGLPARTMGRALDEDPAFFAAALASGTALAEETESS